MIFAQNEASVQVARGGDDLGVADEKIDSERQNNSIADRFAALLKRAIYIQAKSMSYVICSFFNTGVVGRTDVTAAILSQIL